MPNSTSAPDSIERVDPMRDPREEQPLEAEQDPQEDQGMDPAMLARHLSVDADMMRAFRAQMEARERNPTPPVRPIE